MIPSASSPTGPRETTPLERATLDKGERAGLERAVLAASASGQTQWIARVVETRGVDALKCHSHCRAQDRFYWERPDRGERIVAWGRVDDIESAGRERFRDVEAWSAGIRARLHWIGAERAETAPLIFGGFGFEDEAAPVSEWKAFPAARFVLPGTLGDEREGRARWVVLARIDPGALADAVESELATRLAEAEAFADSAAPRRARSEDAVFDALAVADWPAGPEYRVQSDRAHAVFRAQVDHALEAIEAGTLEKVVLARSLRVDHDGPLDVSKFLERLREIYPSCTVVAIGRGEDTFLAATPETLVRVKGDRVETAALAGTAPRGRTPAEDAQLAAALRDSAKDRREHAHVVDAIRSGLAPFCSELAIPETPTVRALFGIQHLETAITGRLRSDGSPAAGGDGALLQLVSRLHPTPAVGGVPRHPAREWLRRFEGLDRGWYASPIGWLDAGGGGELCVALRSALIRGGRSGDDASQAWLFAGAGIVSGSEAEQELAETRIKLRALLAPLTEI